MYAPQYRVYHSPWPVLAGADPDEGRPSSRLASSSPPAPLLLVNDESNAKLPPSALSVASDTPSRRRSAPILKLCVPTSFVSAPLIAYGPFHRTGTGPQPPTPSVCWNVSEGKMVASGTEFT